MTQSSNSSPYPPLTARSVLASALLGADPPELPVSYLIHLARLFDVNENRARVALSRMVASGEVTTDGHGRYRLAGDLLVRQRRQAISRMGRTRRWKGNWHLVVVTAAGRAPDVRNRRRRDLTFNRMAELREGVWLRPDNLYLQLSQEAARDVTVMHARPVDDRLLARELWELSTWSERAFALVDELEALPPDSFGQLAPGFELAASVLRHLQGDPLLPSELLPHEWPGEHLRVVYDDWDSRYRKLLGAWIRSG